MQEIGAAEDTPDDIVFDHLQRTAFPGSADRPPDARHPRQRAFDQREQAARSISRAITAGPTWWSRQPARSSTAGSWTRRSGCSPASPSRSGRHRKPARFVGGTYIERQDLEQAHLALAMEGLPQRDPQLVQPAGVHQRAGRRHVVAAVPGGARDPRSLLFDLQLPHGLFRHRLLRHLCRHRRQRCARTDAGRGRRDRSAPSPPSPRPRSPAPRRR